MSFTRGFLTIGILIAFPLLVAAQSQLLLPTQTEPQPAAPSVPAAAPVSSNPKIDDLTTRIRASDLSDGEKQAALDILSRAIQNQKGLREAVRKSEQFKVDLLTVSDRVEAIKEAGAALANAQAEDSDEFEGSLSSLESKLASMNAEIASLKQNAEDAESLISKSAQRRVEIDSELPKLQASLDRRGAQLLSATTAADGSLAGAANLIELDTSSKYLETQIRQLRNEKALLDSEAAANLPQLNLDKLSAQLESMEKRYQTLKKIVETKRAEEAAARVEKADRQIYELHPALQPIGVENQRLASLDQELAAKIEAAERQLSDRKLELEKMREQHDEAAERVKQVGLTAAVGAMLRNIKQNLPNSGGYRHQIRYRSTTIDDVNYELMDMTDRRNGSLTREIDALFRESKGTVTPEQMDQLKQEARELLQEQRSEYLDAAIRSQTKYFNTLVEISTTEEVLIQIVDAARRYINENVFWTQSTQPLPSRFVPSESELWFANRSAWSEVGTRFAADFSRRTTSWFLAFAAIFVLIASRYRLRDRITEIGQQASQSRFTHFYPTFQTLLLTVAASAPIPVLFWFLGERLGSVAGEDRTINSLSVASKVLAASYALLELTRHVCRTKGLAECHFDWPPHAIVTVRRNLRLLLYVAVPFITFASFLAAGSQGYGNDVLERYFYLAALVVLCVFLVRTIHPRRGAPARFLGKFPNGWANRLSTIWYPSMIAVPVLLGGLSVIGYHFTSWQLAGRFFQSIALLFSISVVVSLAMRWSSIHRRRLRMEQLRQQRLALESEAPKGEAELPITLLEESAEELQEQMEQTRSLFQTVMATAAFAGLWIVWSDVIPALDYLDKWPAWTSTQVVTEWAPNSEGLTTPTYRETPDPITYAEIGLALIIATISLAAARNLPGLLEFAILRRLPLDRSVRYAITALVSYVIILLGLVAAGSTIGLHWNQVQWMATALTFGLAFGLQEMFANFVSGIIILFEQPVRVGDVVEIDGVTGIVSKIRIRATTITDWDRKDYIVPNKEFITGKLLNWTRSDEIVRITVPVGVAYGSDTKRTRELLLQSAKEHSEVLSEPPVLATFEGFGESCLDFYLKVFIRSYERRHHVAHDLHMAIDEKFRKADIEISFPQRDLHLRSCSEDLAMMMRPSESDVADL